MDHAIQIGLLAPKAQRICGVLSFEEAQALGGGDAFLDEIKPVPTEGRAQADHAVTPVGGECVLRRPPAVVRPERRDLTDGPGDLGEPRHPVDLRSCRAAAAGGPQVPVRAIMRFTEAAPSA